MTGIWKSEQGAQSAEKAVTQHEANLISDPSTGQGALLVRGSVVYVDTIADLADLPVGELLSGQQVQTKGTTFEYRDGAFRALTALSPFSSGVIADGVNDDAGGLAAAVSDAANYAVALRSDTVATALTSQTIIIPTELHCIDIKTLTVKQADDANLPSIFSFSGIENGYADYTVRVDGNRDNNPTSSAGVIFDATAAGDRVAIDVSGINCETLLKLSREIEHCRIKAHGRQCGTVVVANTATNSMDENDISVYGYQVETLYRSEGSVKSSALLRLFSEVVYSWAVDLNNGWYTLEGIVRTCGEVSGGGIRIAGSTKRVLFSNLQLYGASPAPNNATWGLLCESSAAFLEGDLILGKFDGGAWIKTCKTGSSLRINISSNSDNGPAIRFGDKAGGNLLNGADFSINTQGAGAGHPGVEIDNAANCVFRLLGDFRGESGDLVISADSFDNTIEVGRRAAFNRVVSNNRAQNDNVILFKGSYNYADLELLNGGSYFPGMWIEELRVSPSIRSRAYYDAGIEGWVPVSNQLESEDDATIASASASINTIGKYTGKRVWDFTNNRELRASGSAPTADWHVIDGSASVTPG